MSITELNKSEVSIIGGGSIGEEWGGHIGQGLAAAAALFLSNIVIGISHHKDLGPTNWLINTATGERVHKATIIVSSAWDLVSLEKTLKVWGCGIVGNNIGAALDGLKNLIWRKK
jgi:hypothetical protein